VTSSAIERQRAELRAEIARAAVGLFTARGFDATTVDDIAAAVGVSRRTFFRYFGTKEDVLLHDLNARGDAVARALAARPADEEPWVALRAAMLDAAPETLADPESDLAVGRLMKTVPSLRARRHEKRAHWVDGLAPLVAERLTGPGAAFRARAVVSAALLCVDLASEAWIESGGTADLAELYDEAVAAIR
jgi:AcrR family transcriptional regulator